MLEPLKYRIDLNSFWACRQLFLSTRLYFFNTLSTKKTSSLHLRYMTIRHTISSFARNVKLFFGRIHSLHVTKKKIKK